jgi:asparagine synthase (glutamine-hydrolysing)
VLVFDGRLDNREQIQSWVPGGSLTAGESDAAYLLAAYERWGRDLLDHLLGDFAFALWDPRIRQLILARDPLGTRPCYYSSRGSYFSFASTLEQILSDPAAPRELDEPAMVAYLCGDEAVRGRRTCYRDVHILPGGHRLTLSGREIQVTRYWRWPEQPPLPRSATRADAEEFGALFTEAVRCRLRSSSPVGLLLSGGLDSSAIAAVAGSLDRTTGPPPVRAYSLIFDRFAACDERSYSTAVASRHRLPQTWVSGDECWALSHLDEWLPVFTDPHFLPYHGIHFKLLDAARSHGVRSILMGHGGDHLLTGSARYLADWFMQGRWSDLHRQLAVYARLTKRSYPRAFAADVLFPLLPGSLRRQLKRGRRAVPSKAWLPAGLQHSPRREDQESAHSGRHAWWYAMRRQWERFGENPNQAYLDRLSRLFGMELRQPFLDARLIDFVLRLPPEALYRDGTSKRLLREGLDDLMPEVVRDRRTRGSLSPLIECGLRRHRRSFVEALLEDSELEQRGYVLPGPWKAAIHGFLEGDNRQFWSHWRALSLEIWLRAQTGRLPAVEECPTVRAA